MVHTALTLGMANVLSRPSYSLSANLCWCIFILMKRSSSRSLLQLGILVLVLAGCSSRSPIMLQPEQIPPIPPDKWREIQEEIWTASTLAYSEAQNYAHEVMQEWMARVREKTEAEFVPWYTGYWTQQWIGFKAGWYKMFREEDDPSVEDYLVKYFLERYDELVLEPAGNLSDPRLITKQTTEMYVRLLSVQLQSFPKMYAVPLKSLQQRLKQIPMITLLGSEQSGPSLSLLFERNNLADIAAYETLLTHDDSSATLENPSHGRSSLLDVAEDTVARLVAELPLRASGSAAALVVGETIGLIISAGVAAWSINVHEKNKPEIESQLRLALNAGLNDMWKRLMEDPKLGVLVFFSLSIICASRST